MASPKRATWYRTTTRIFEFDFGDDLTDADAGTTATLTGTPSVYLEQQTTAGWVDRSDEVTISSVSVVDGAKTGVASAAVQFTIDGVALDAAEPEAGVGYRFRVDADRDDGQEAGIPVVLLTIAG